MVTTMVTVTTASRVSSRAAATNVPARLLRVTALLALIAGCGDLGIDDAPPGEEAVTTARSALTATADRALLITTTSVTVDADRTKDPCSAVPGDEHKVWTLGHMLEREATKTSNNVTTYVNSWMSSWTSTTTINGDTIPPLQGPATRTNWRNFAGGGLAMPVHKAPFWLLAIVNRLDLRKHRPGGEPLGGELRFVFGFLPAPTPNPPCPTTGGEAEAAIIVEYSPNKADENQVRDYARRWLELSNKDPATEDYKDALEALTEEVIQQGKLLRIRTNEFRLGGVGGKVWDLAEFEPDPGTKRLRRSTVKQSPTMALINGSQKMSDWMWKYRGDLFANAFDYEVGRSGNRAVTEPPIGSYFVQDAFEDGSLFFRGGVNSTGGGTIPFWGGPTPTGLPSELLPDWIDARFRFSVGTCLGCHGGETGSHGPLHIFPGGSGFGSEANRSPLLRGPLTVADPLWGDGVTRNFDEMTRRENDLRNLVNGAPVTNPVFGNNYTVRFKASGKCLDSVGNTTTDGALSQLYTCHGNGNQRLSLVAQSPGVYKLKYKHSSKCIDVVNASTTNDARVEQRTCSSTRNSQKLTLSTLSGTIPSTRVLRFQHSNLCLLVRNQGTTNGTAIVQATCPSSSDFSKGFDLVE